MTDRAARHFARGLARAGGGALLFSLPLVMTMEMWALGHLMSPLRLALFVGASLPLLVGLSHLVGFEETLDLLQDGVDACVALAIGFGTAAGALFLLHVLGAHSSLREVAGAIGLLAVVGAIGALLAQSQLHAGSGDDRRARERDKRIESSYAAQLLAMLIGALFLSLNVAPTEEITLLAATMTPWHLAGLLLLSLVIMHAFVYSLEFKGHQRRAPGHSALVTTLRYTVSGYALAALVSLGVLWLFGRTDGAGLGFVAAQLVVLAFPAAIGAAAARLIL